MQYLDDIHEEYRKRFKKANDKLAIFVAFMGAFWVLIAFMDPNHFVFSLVIAGILFLAALLIKLIS